MSREIAETVYTFSELDDSAKERARNWYRDGALDYAWYEYVYEDAAKVAAMLGIDLRQKPVRLMGGGTRYDPCIWFSGFSSQGDGACFEGTYEYKKGCARAVKRYAPDDKDLAQIAAGLVSLQRAHFYRLTARCAHRGRYYHSGCMSVDVGLRDGWDAPREAEDALTDILRSFADWIYRRLESEHDYLMSDECIDESIIANEYEFDEEGNLA